MLNIRVYTYTYTVHFTAGFIKPKNNSCNYSYTKPLW